MDNVNLWPMNLDLESLGASPAANANANIHPSLNGTGFSPGSGAGGQQGNTNAASTSVYTGAGT